MSSRTGPPAGSLSLYLCAASLATLAACGDRPPAAAVDKVVGKVTAAEKNVFISESLEIDRVGAGPGDANLLVDGTASHQLPAGGPTPFTDWDALGGRTVTLSDGTTLSGLEVYRYLDDLGSGGKDSTSFPRSNECIGASSVLSKMDLTYISAASNSKYAYFGVQRSGNSGDAAYYWILTRKAPKKDASPLCKAGEGRLVYDITQGDVMLIGHFHTTTDPLSIYRATRNQAGIAAISALDVSAGGLWALDTSSVTAAVNTTAAAPGSFGSAGVVARTADGKLGPEIFVEAAVPLSVFSADGCGATLFASVVTRSSGSGGTISDLKDYADVKGTALDFGEVEATPHMDSNCDAGGFTYSVDVTGRPGITATCAWTFKRNGAVIGTSSTCSGTFAAAAGDYTGEVTVTASDPLSTCRKTATTTANVPVGERPTIAAATLTGGCEGTFAYAGSATTASGQPPTYAWTFSGADEDGAALAVTPAASGTASGTSGMLGAGSYQGSLKVTDPASGCSATLASNTVKVGRRPVLAASLSPLCQAFSYGVTVEPAGLSKGRAYAWTFGPGGTSPSSSSAASGTVAVEAGGLSYTGSVTVTDPFTGCSATTGASTTPVAPPTVTLTAAVPALMCPLESDAVTVQAVTTCTNCSFTWIGQSCTGTSCTFGAPPDTLCHTATVQVQVAEASGLCPPGASNTLTYSKKTSITIQ